MNWDAIPDAVPKAEPLSEKGNPENYTVLGQRYTVNFDTRNFTQQGTASWYGTKFHGKLTSSGEPYDMYQMTAAHKTLPLPSYVQVTNLQNQKKIIVKVNDRGPFVDGRIIDLSYAAARKLGITQTGTAQVQLDIINPNDKNTTLVSNDVETFKAEPVIAPVLTPVDAAVQINQDQPPGQPITSSVITDTVKAESTLDTDTSHATNNYYLQLAAFSQRQLAENLREQLLAQKITPIIIATFDHENATLYKVRVGPLDSAQQLKAIETRLSELGYTQSLLIVE